MSLTGLFNILVHESDRVFFWDIQLFLYDFDHNGESDFSIRALIVVAKVIKSIIEEGKPFFVDDKGLLTKSDLLDIKRENWPMVCMGEFLFGMGTPLESSTLLSGVLFRVELLVEAILQLLMSALQFGTLYLEQ